MILETNSKTETNCNIVSNTFTIKASPLAFDILSSKLYADPVLAIVRELLTNAYDSQKAAGNEDAPIKVHLPDYEENFLSFRDYGLGLSKEDILTIYTSFFNSTKSTNNDYTGCFGLGSKTPFSYTSSFSVNSYFNGTKYYYLAIKKDGSPNIYCIKEEPTDEPNGLEIIIPLKEADKYNNNFSTAINDYLSFIPEIKVDCNRTINKPTYYGSIKNIHFYSRGAGKSIIYIKQGQNVYAIDYNYYNINNSNININHNYLIVVEVPIGTLGITPSRESLSKDENNINKIAYIMDIVEKDIHKYILDNYNNNNNDNIIINCLSNMLVSAINKKYNLKHKIHSIYKNEVISYLPNNIEYRIITDNDNYYSHLLPLNKNKETLFILVNPNKIPKTSKTIDKILFNYPELKNKDIIIITNDNFIELDKLKPSVFKEFYDYIFMLNNIEALNLNCSIIGFTKFHRLYPNSRMPRRKSSEINLSDIYINYNYCCINNSDYYSGSSSDNISSIYSRHTSKNTIVFAKQEDDNYYSILNNIKDVYNIVSNTHNFMYDYFTNLGLDADHEIYFLRVGKTRLKYFKDYVQINPEEVLNYALDADWKVLCNADNDYAVPEIEEFIRHSYSKKAQEIILNSRVFRKLKRINQYKSKFINRYINTNYLEALKNNLNTEQYNKLCSHFININGDLTKFINNDEQLKQFINWYTYNSKNVNRCYWHSKRNNPRTSKYIMNSIKQKEIFNYI